MRQFNLLFFKAFFVKRRVERIEILAVETVGGDAQSFAEALVVDNFALAEKP